MAAQIRQANSWHQLKQTAENHLKNANGGLPANIKWKKTLPPRLPRLVACLFVTSLILCQPTSEDMKLYIIITNRPAASTEPPTPGHSSLTRDWTRHTRVLNADIHTETTDSSSVTAAHNYTYRTHCSVAWQRSNSDSTCQPTQSR